MQNINLSSSVEIVQGQRGSGKWNSLKGKHLSTIPLYIVDIRNEWKHIPAFISLQHFSYFILDHRNRKYVKYPNQNKYYKEGQYRFVLSTQRELLLLFSYFKSFRNCTIIVDEADALYSDHKLKYALNDVFLGSRNNNVSMIYAVKRPFLIPILVRSQADKFTIFFTEEKLDINYLEGRIQKAFPKDPASLKRGEAIIIEQGKEPQLYQYDKFVGD